MPCETISDPHGTSFYIADVDTQTSPGGRVLPGSASVEVWWARLFKDNREEKLLIRQENRTDRADVVEVTLGQLYDLIDALNKAVEVA
jgi:hypothetical protein